MSFGKRFYALGRNKPGEMNQTEAAFGQHLEVRKRAGATLWYAFEAIKLRLADNTFFTPDWAEMAADAHLHIYDVKGSRAVYTDDARVKIKVAAEIFPFLHFHAAWPTSRRGLWTWEFEDF